MTTAAIELPTIVVDEVLAPVDLMAFVPDGTAPPADIPPAVFDLALETYLAGRRLDMQALAGALGISRSTLYRRVGDRDRLLGAVVWYLTRQVVVPALEASATLTGPQRVLAAIGGFMAAVSGQPALRALLDAEPEAALRILTSKHGPVQGHLVALLEQLLAAEESRGHLRLTTDRRTLAYVIVRIGESFLYADVIADNEPDVALAMEIIGRLLPQETL